MSERITHGEALTAIDNMDDFMVGKDAEPWLDVSRIITDYIAQQSRKETELERENAALRERLEIDHAYDSKGNRIPAPKGMPDGIAARDATIKLLENIIAKISKREEKLELKNIELEAQLDIVCGLAEEAISGFAISPAEETFQTIIKVAKEVSNETKGNTDI